MHITSKTFRIIIFYRSFLKKNKKHSPKTDILILPPTFFSAKDAVCPPRTSLTGILLRWMDLTAMGMKMPRGSGPRSSVSLSRIIPRNVVPETTVPTP